MRRRKDKMIEEECELVCFEELGGEPDAYVDPKIFDDGETDEDLKHYLREEQNKKRREIDDDEEEDEDNNRYHKELNDPDYEFFLENLEAHEQSYMLKTEVEENGSIVCVFIKYEAKLNLYFGEGDFEPRRKLRSYDKQKTGDSSKVVRLKNHRKRYSQSVEKLIPDKEGGVESRRTLRSAANRGTGDSDQILCLEDHRKQDSLSTSSKATVKLPQRQLGKKTNSKKGNYVKLSMSLKDKGEFEDDFLTWLEGVEYFGEDSFYESEGYYVEYNRTDEECNLVNEEYNDESLSDVEILPSNLVKEEYDDDESSSNVEILGSTPGEEENSGSSEEKFMQKVETALRKPYNRQEYERLLRDIKICRPIARHLDLRHGRERSYSAGKQGKSYLDHYPDLKREFLKVVNDKPRCLNLLRGFFVWLQQPGEKLFPWKDEKLLAIKPRSG